MKGFTLIELLVVVLIIGILSSVALPQYQKAVNKARTVEAIETLAFVEREAQVYYLANGTVNKAFYDDLDLPSLKYFQLGSHSWNTDGANSFFALRSKNGEISVTSHFVNGVNYRYCTGKCKSYFTEENCEDSTLRNNIDDFSSAKCKLK